MDVMNLVAKELACVRGGRTVFQDLSFSVSAGSGLLLRGPNGSGKTSLLRTIAGLIPRAAGTLMLDGGDPDATVPEQCHFIGHQNGIKRALTVAENLDFWCRYLGGRTITDALDRLHLSDLADIPAGYLSAGQSRRLGLARLVAAHRPLWLLDEPSVSLDTASCGILADIMREHIAAGGIVAASTHADLGLAFDQTLTLGKVVSGP